MLVLGINAAYHESAAAVVRDGEVLFAVEEERLTRVKHGKVARASNPDELPWRAIRACLDELPVAGVEVDAIAYSLVPGLRLETLGPDPCPGDAPEGFGTEAGEREFDARVRGVPALIGRERGGLGDPGNRIASAPVRFIPHHVAHAASAFYPSSFESAAVLVVDGIGERATAWLGRGAGGRLEPVEEVLYPRSIGMLWERVAVWLGFTAYDAPKVMGLAAFGDAGPHLAALDRLFAVTDPDGGRAGVDPPPFAIDPALARFRAAGVAGLESLFGPGRREGESPEEARFAGVAAALQRRTEEAVLALARRLGRATGERRLAYAGGVALNCLANARLEREGPFDEIYVPSAAHDAGTAIGAALEAAPSAERRRAAGDRPPVPFLGPEHGGREIEAALARAGLAAERVADPAAAAARLLAAGALVGWFQGRLELGPRALGHRSLLADPRRADVRDDLNRRIKHREPFRPFAASFLAEAAADWLELPAGRPGAAASRDLMLVAYPVRPARRAAIPAVVHRDGTCRAQVIDRRRDPRFHALVSHLGELTGVPAVLNTSFNDREPIVGSPADAIETFRRAGLDALFLEDCLVRRPAT